MISAWPPAQDLYRRANERNNSRPSSPAAPPPSKAAADTQHRRASSDVTSVPQPPKHRLGLFGASSSSQSQSPAASPSSSTGNQQGSSRTLLQPRSNTHARAESALALPRESSGSPVASGSMSLMASSVSPQTAINPPSKGHPSPSKASSARTYDSKLVSREMHRLGTLAHAHLPAALAPSLSGTGAASATSLALPPSTSALSTGLPAIAGVGTTADNPWGALHVHVLPLFNGEPLRIPIEDLNTLVRRHIQTVVSHSPSKALATLEHDAGELIAAGMVTLNAKLLEIDDDKLVHRVVEIWGFFWDQVLPYVEGVLLPLQTDAILSSLYRTPKTHRPSSPTRQNSSSISMSISVSLSLSTPHIDVRTVALRSFRDRIILPLFSRLQARLNVPNRQDSFPETVGYQQPRLQQMLLVLASQGGRQRPPSFSLTAPTPQPTAGEVAVSDLLRTVRSPTPPQVAATAIKGASGVRAPSFLSGGLPRDRRGRIAQKGKQRHGGVSWVTADGFGIGGDDGEGEDSEGDETPRNERSGGLADPEREREREFLEALRSPDPSRASIGGWGLGVGNEDSGKALDEDDEDDALDWDEAQAVVERMVGMKPNANETTTTEGRRRMT